MTSYLILFIALQIVLLYPSFGFYRRATERMGLAHVKAAPYIATFVLPLVFIGIFMWFNVRFMGPWIRSSPFDSAEWKDDPRGRYTMVNDLKDSRLLIGKTRDEVIALLGPDMEQGPCTACIGYSTHEPDQAVSIDHEVLEIDFDPQGRVSAVTVTLW